MPGKPYHHGDLKRTLVDVTRQVIEEEGPESVTMARVARACSVSVAAPYRHFADKRTLLGAVAGQGFRELAEALAQAARSRSSAREQLVESGVAYVRFALAHPQLFRLMFSADLRPQQTEAGPPALGELELLVRQVDLRVSGEVALRTTWALAHGLASLRVGGMRSFVVDDTEERLREELTALLDGVARAPEDPPIGYGRTR